MKNDEIIRQYYESEISKMPDLEPSPWLMRQADAISVRPGRIGWEDVFGAAITLGYLVQLLAPANWFSFGRFLFIFRFWF